MFIVTRCEIYFDKSYACKVSAAHVIKAELQKNTCFAAFCGGFKSILWLSKTSNFFFQITITAYRILKRLLGHLSPKNLEMFLI